MTNRLHDHNHNHNEVFTILDSGAEQVKSFSTKMAPWTAWRAYDAALNPSVGYKREYSSPFQPFNAFGASSSPHPYLEVRVKH